METQLFAIGAIVNGGIELSRGDHFLSPTWLGSWREASLPYATLKPKAGIM